MPTSKRRAVSRLEWPSVVPDDGGALIGAEALAQLVRDGKCAESRANRSLPVDYASQRSDCYLEVLLQAVQEVPILPRREDEADQRTCRP